MDTFDFFHCFQFDDQFFFNKKIDPICTIELNALIFNG